MGDLKGHVLIGGFFLFTAIWHLLESLTKFYRETIVAGNTKYINTSATRTNLWRLVKFPLESWLRVFGICVAVILEFKSFTENDPETHHGSHSRLENRQHMLMYFIFIFGSIFDYW